MVIISAVWFKDEELFMKEDKNYCERPKTNGEILLEIFKLFFRYFDKNKTEAIILIFGVVSALNISVMSQNLLQNLQTVINFVKGFI